MHTDEELYDKARNVISVIFTDIDYELAMPQNGLSHYYVKEEETANTFEFRIAGTTYFIAVNLLFPHIGITLETYVVEEDYTAFKKTRRRIEELCFEADNALFQIQQIRRLDNKYVYDIIRFGAAYVLLFKEYLYKNNAD